MNLVLIKEKKNTFGELEPPKIHDFQPQCCLVIFSFTQKSPFFKIPKGSHPFHCQQFAPLSTPWENTCHQADIPSTHCHIVCISAHPYYVSISVPPHPDGRCVLPRLPLVCPPNPISSCSSVVTSLFALLLLSTWPNESLSTQNMMLCQSRICFLNTAHAPTWSTFNWLLKTRERGQEQWKRDSKQSVDNLAAKTKLKTLCLDTPGSRLIKVEVSSQFWPACWKEKKEAVDSKDGR